MRNEASRWFYRDFRIFGPYEQGHFSDYFLCFLSLEGVAGGVFIDLEWCGQTFLEGFVEFS